MRLLCKAINTSKVRRLAKLRVCGCKDRLGSTIYSKTVNVFLTFYKMFGLQIIHYFLTTNIKGNPLNFLIHIIICFIW